MSKLTTRGRTRIAGKNFVFPKGTKAAQGEPKFPIHDRTHARSALSRAGQKKTKLTKTERCAVVKKVCKKFPKLGLCETGKVSAKSAIKRAGCAELARWKKTPGGGRKRTYKDSQGYTVTQWEGPSYSPSKAQKGRDGMIRGTFRS